MDPQTVVVLQPQIAVAPASSNAWQTGLLDCCSDFGVCLCGIVCCCFLDCKIADEMGECCCCGSSVAMRTLYRTKYRIPGSIFSDFCITRFCPLCSLCQIKRDINIRKKMRIF